MNEDSDIKIFDPGQKGSGDSDVLNMVELIDHHRRNGNVGRARKLGVTLAKVAMHVQPSEELDDAFLGPDVYPEVGVLVLFCAESALNYFLPATQLSAIAISSLHETLGDTHSELYKNIVESPAYSFYYLSVRKGGENVSQSIGETFAMLCRREGDPEFIACGKRVYETVLKEVEKKTKEAGFED